MTRGFGPDDARQFYDRFGVKQDWQAFYENRAIEDLIAHTDFSHARAVFEFGFGTGRLAEQLLSHYLQQNALYSGTDISSTMARLAQERLRPWRDRAMVKVGDGAAGFDAADNSFDRFVSAYVFDILSKEDAHSVIKEAHRILVPGGKLCLISLVPGATGWCGIVTRVWESVYRTNPRLVGGCRPIELIKMLDPALWKVEYRNSVCAYGISSEVIVAHK